MKKEQETQKQRKLNGTNISIERRFKLQNNWPYRISNSNIKF